MRGDIHCDRNALIRVINSVDFNKKTDLLFAFGGLGDRGFNSKAIFTLFIDTWFHFIEGNHDEFIEKTIECIGHKQFKAIDMHKLNGGEWLHELPE